MVTCGGQLGSLGPWNVGRREAGVEEGFEIRGDNWLFWVAVVYYTTYVFFGSGQSQGEGKG